MSDSHQHLRFLTTRVLLGQESRPHANSHHHHDLNLRLGRLFFALFGVYGSQNITSSSLLLEFARLAPFLPSRYFASMALVDPAPCSFNDVLQNPERSSWSAPIDFDRTQASKQNQASRCSLAPAVLGTGTAGAQAPKLEFIESFASLSVPRLDLPLSLSRISGDGFDWYTVDTPPATPIPAPDIKPDPEPDPLQKKPFHRWIRSLHRRTSHKDPEPKKKASATPPDFPEPVKHAPTGTSLHPPPLSASGSSLRFVSAVRSASVSLASVSAVTRPRKLIARSRHLSRTDRSSRASFSVPRVSEDSVAVDQSAIVDVATTERSIQRRQILEELITTEEAYIGDVRFLIHVSNTARHSFNV